MVEQINPCPADPSGRCANGPFRLSFTKDDTGTVVKCRLVLPNLDLDVTGNKLK
jgi:hypothetical protein